MGKFEAWLVNPQGKTLKVPTITGVDIEIEKERLQLLAEANARDLQAALPQIPEIVIDEHFMDVDDEKVDVSVSMSNLSMKTQRDAIDFEMVNLAV